MSGWDGACLRPGCAPIRAPGARGRHGKRGPAFSPAAYFFLKGKKRKYDPNTDLGP